MRVECIKCATIMAQRQMTVLSLLCIEKGIEESLQFEDVNDCCAKNARRMLILWYYRISLLYVMIY